MVCDNNLKVSEVAQGTDQRVSEGVSVKSDGRVHAVSGYLEKIARAVEPSAQRRVYDDVNKIIANFNTLGVGTDEEYLRERILRKFSRSARKWVWTELKRHTPATSL